jgi:hypothetical protein
MRFKYEPAVYLYAANALVALAVAYGLPLTELQTAAVTTIATAVLTVWTAFRTRPVDVSAVTAAVGIALTALTAFKLNLSSDMIGTTVGFGSILLALVLRQNVSPVVNVAAALSNDRTERPYRA